MIDQKEYKCLCCEKVVNNHGECFSNRGWIIFGYGSKHDMSKFFITICDSCISEKQAKGIVDEPVQVSFN